jgi:glutaryl-CoA dehydrogenase
MGAVAYGLAMQELERGDSGVRSFASVQGALCMYPIYAYGSEEQKNKYLPEMAKGKLIGCFGLTEPDFGSNPSGMLTKAEKRGDKWILNGSKMWITNGGICDLAIVWAKTSEGVMGFVVERDKKGFTTKNIEGKFSLRASVTSELNFENVELSDDARLPKIVGMKGPLGCLNQARFGIGWGVLGAAQSVFDEALNYGKNRIQFDRPIAGFQLVQQKLVWMATEITKGQLLALRVGRLKESGKLHHTHVSMVKMNNCWVARECCYRARDILGANGIHDEYQVGRHLCNIESVFTYEGTHDIHTLILGQHLTGLNAFQ